MNNQFYMDLATIIVSVVALLVSYFSLLESKKARIELGRAFLSMNLVQTSEGLYVMLHNIGNSYAYDVNVTVSKDFVNGFENLSTIQPGDVYRYLLLHPQNVSDYPEIIRITIQYHDYYSSIRLIEKNFEFKIIDFLKFDMKYNKDFNCYDIKKSF